ncbi:sensor histidine kinase [Gemmatimonas sp.]
MIMLHAAAVQSAYAGGVTYRETVLMFWGLQLAFAAAMAAVLASLSVRLGRPLMSALATWWIMRVLLALTLMPYFLGIDPARNDMLVMAGLYGAVALGGVPVAMWVSRTALAPLPHSISATGRGLAAWRRSSRVWLPLGAAVGLALHAFNIRDGFSEHFGALWTRAVVFAPLVLLAAALWRGHARHPDRRAVSTPLLLGAAVLVASMVIDTVLRLRLITVLDAELSGLLSLANGLGGSLVFAVASVLASVVAEREALSADERRLEEAVVRTAEARRLQSLGSLASGIAHDFNNILSAILSGSQLAGGALVDDPEVARSDLEHVRLAAMRGTNLSKRLLTFARRQTDSPALIDPGQVVRDVAPMLERLLGQRISLHTSVATGYALRIVPTQYEQIVVNLAINARDAISGSGRIDLAVSAHDVETTTAYTLGSVNPGQWVRLAVCDTGAGMSDETMERLFEPFFTTKGEGGTGLGLATVASAVRDAGGAIAVHSVPGSGTRFEIWLPAATSDEPSNNCALVLDARSKVETSN